MFIWTLGDIIALIMIGIAVLLIIIAIIIAWTEELIKKIKKRFRR